MDEMEIIRRRLSYLGRDNQFNLGKLYALQQELEGVLEDKEAGAGGEISKAVTIQVPEEENAMTNPVILSNIFCHLELSTLFDLRLVCKVWDEVVISSPEFSKRVYLQLPKLFPFCTVAPVPAINPNLAKNIYIKNRYKCMSESEGYYNVKLRDLAHTADIAFKNLMAFFNQYQNVVENIRLKCHWEVHDSNNTHLLMALNKLDFPKLRGIIIIDKFNTSSIYGYLWKWNDDDLISTLDHFATRPSLTSLQFQLDDTIAGSPFHDVFQKLIYSAPNLEEITIRGNFYPDLSSCKNLKTLSCSGIPYYYPERKCLWQEPSFKLESLSKMLDQVKHLLIKLSLEDSYLDGLGTSDTWDHLQLGKFKFPDVLKKLEVLRIQEYSGKPFFQPELKKLSPDQFPKLKNLSIAVEKCPSFDMYHTGVKTLDNVFGGMSHKFWTISSLHLSGTISPDCMHLIPVLFPNLMKLTMPWSVSKEDEKPDFDSVIDFCSGWKLQELDISTAMQCDWSAVVEGLGRLKHTQSNIRMLTLRLPTTDGKSFCSEKPMFDLWYDANKKLQQVGTETLDLQNLSFRPISDVITKAIEEAVWKILSDHSLRVFFI